VQNGIKNIMAPSGLAVLERNISAMPGIRKGLQFLNHDCKLQTFMKAQVRADCANDEPL
jgi:hypothetical protein